MKFKTTVCWPDRQRHSRGRRVTLNHSKARGMPATHWLIKNDSLSHSLHHPLASLFFRPHILVFPTVSGSRTDGKLTVAAASVVRSEPSEEWKWKKREKKTSHEEWCRKLKKKKLSWEEKKQLKSGEADKRSSNIFFKLVVVDCHCYHRYYHPSLFCRRRRRRHHIIINNIIITTTTTIKTTTTTTTMMMMIIIIIIRGRGGS